MSDEEKIEVSDKEKIDMPLTSSVLASELSSKTLRAGDYVFQSLKAHLVADLRDIHEKRQKCLAQLRNLEEKEARILASFT